jgi:hypothetical protein
MTAMGFASLYPSYILASLYQFEASGTGMRGRNGQAGQQNQHRSLLA